MMLPPSASSRLPRSDGRSVAFVIGKLAGRSGGAQRVLIETANALAVRGHRVEIVTHERSPGPPFYPLASGVTLSNLQPPRPGWRAPLDKVRDRLERSPTPDTLGLRRLAWLSRHGAFWRRLGAHLRATRPDVAVAFMPPAVSALALARTSHPLRRVASMHNAPEQDFLNPERWDTSHFDRLRRLALMSRMDRIAVLLPEYRDWYVSPMRSSICVLPNAVAPVAPERLAGPERTRVVMAVGRLVGAKRHALLIEAWRRLAPGFPDWQLRIFGEGPLHETLRSQVAASGLSSIHLMGHTQAIADQYLSAAFLAHPAEFEGFPLAVTEALASGLPVVGFEDCSGLSALVRNDVNGVLVSAKGDRVESLAEALAGLMVDDVRRQALSSAGPASVAAYHPEAIIERWEELLFGDNLP